VAFWSGVGGTALADDWPQWRGRNRDAVCTETGLLKQWPANGPRLVWKANGLGEGYSGVSVVAGRIFTMGDLGGSSCVLALNAADGKVIWTTKVGQAGGGGGYPGPRCTPTFDSGLVYAMNQYGDIVCVKADTGAEVWRARMGSFGGRMMSEWGYSESPLVDGDRLVCTPGGPNGAVLALDKKTGQPVWQSKELTDSASYASLVPATIGGVKQYIVFTDKNVAGIAAANGKVLWRAPREGRVAVIPTPIYKNGIVYVTSGYGVGCNAFRITGSGTSFRAEPIYANTAMVDHHGGVVLVGDYVYGHSDSRGWVCMKLATGEVAWAERREAPHKGSILYADGRLYLRAEDGAGTIALVEATPSGYKEISRFDQPDRSSKNSWPHPVIANGKLYLRDQDVLLCYDVKAP
jgi:outer membrane protein assembly factor BamB